jgi:hypothetical protein
MPIKPENKAKYPKHWPAISASIRKRAGHRCEWEGCAARQYSVGVWQPGAAGLFTWLALLSDNSNPRTYLQARQNAAEIDGIEGEGPKPIVIVLTVAHLNHDPADCRPENLKALCQRHHLALDADHHRANAQATRRARAGTLELF